jgi:hypothetical protein
VRFVSKDDPSEIKKIVNRIVGIYGPDDSQQGEWNESDESKLENTTFRRVWTIEKGESFISIEYNIQDGISLNILFFNNLMKVNPSEVETR